MSEDQGAAADRAEHEGDEGRRRGCLGELGLDGGSTSRDPDTPRRRSPEGRAQGARARALALVMDALARR